LMVGWTLRYLLSHLSRAASVTHAVKTRCSIYAHLLAKSVD